MMPFFESMKQVQQMLALCQGMSSLAAMASPYAVELSALCKKACMACAAECEAHSAHHEECKNCFEACQGSVAAMDRLIAS